MILDDGSHMSSHMIYSFEHLFGSVKSGGVYVIEDIGCSYWEDYEGGYLKPKRMVHFYQEFGNNMDHLIWYWMMGHI